jgi:lipopolysaccharide transport system permease protein/teichoic acid transport system permease protein
MVKKDFKNQFLGSFLGIVWAFIQPLVLVLVLWFVFAVGFRQGRSVEPVPFVLWLMTGMFCWFFISDSISGSTAIIVQNSHLVRKIRFQLSILPLVKILSSLLIHVIFISFTVVLFLAHGQWPTLYWLQLCYYLAAAIFFSMGLSWITSSISVFIKDVQQIVQILVRIGFWFTPIFWKVEKLPEKVRALIKLNPACYLVQGYRDSIIYNIGFWERPHHTLYFWGVTLLLFMVGALVFKRLRPHFADVL